MDTIEDIKGKMRAELKAARDITLKASAEGRNDLTSEELEAATTHLKSFEGFKQELARKEKHAVDSQAMKGLLDQFGADLGLERTPDVDRTPEGFVHLGKGATLGDAFTRSAEYKGLMGGFREGNIPEKARLQSDSFGVKSLFGRKAVVTGAGAESAGAFVTPEATGILELMGRTQLTLRDLVSVRQTTSDTVEFVQQTVQPTAAAPVAEATTDALPAPDGTLAAGGGYKPQGNIAFKKVTAPVRTIAEWIAATRRSIADASQLRGLIDQELKADLAQVEEWQMLNGDGTGENLTGILNTSGIQTQARSATVEGVDPLLETTLKAKTKARIGGRTAPTGYLVNPQDWEAIQLARIAKNPANEAIAGGIPTLHGLPVAESENIAVGTALVGDFSRAVLWDREQAAVSITDSHADFFIRNLVAILAEERVAFGVTRPKALVRITLGA